MAASKRKASKTSGKSPAKKAATGKSRPPKLQDDPVWSTSNLKSHLVKEDLHVSFLVMHCRSEADQSPQALYSDPTTYINWTKEDWDEVRDCFPHDVPLEEDGYSVSIHYLKHNQDWRRHIREYQEDLGAGKYDPTWLAEAAEAMEERARGDFDGYKENEYEEFWGQKQKTDRSYLAGESSKIKLEELLEAGVLQPGDELSYRRHFKRDRGEWMVEKEMRVSHCVILSQGSSDSKPHQIVKVTATKMEVAIPPGQLRFPRVKGTQANGVDGEAENENTPQVEGKANGIHGDGVSADDHSEEVIVMDVSILKQLENKILDIDGRESSKDAPASSPWRAIRARRNNQDLGALFEMRDDLYIRRESKIVRTPKKKT